MLVIGLILLLVAAGALVGAIFVSEGTDVTFYGIEVTPLTLYLLGAVTVALLWAALLLIRSGTKREIRIRREHKQLTKEQARPATDPPATDPPATDPPASDPPASRPGTGPDPGAR